MTDLIIVVVILAFFSATALLVPALSRLTANSAEDTDDEDAGADTGSEFTVRS